MLWEILGLITLALTIRFAYYFYYYRRAVMYVDVYSDYLKKQDSSSSDKLDDVSGQVAHLMKITGLKGRTIPVVQPMGYGQLASMQIQPYDNLHNLRKDIVSANLGLLDKAKSLCKNMAMETINPVFWLEFFIYLPENALGYIGLNKNGSLIKLLQVFWWLFVAAATVIGVIFNQEFRDWISGAISSLK